MEDYDRDSLFKASFNNYFKIVPITRKTKVTNTVCLFLAEYRDTVIASKRSNSTEYY